MIRYVTKSNGKKEEFNPEKLRKWSEFAAGKLNWSEIELEAVKRCYDGVSTRDLHKAMISACIDKKTQAYSDMAGRLLLGMIYKQAHGGYHSIPSLNDFYRDMVAKGHWIKMDYTEEEIKEIGKIVRHDKNLGYGYSVLRQMSDKYLVKDAVNDIVHESPQFLFIGVAMKVMEIQPKERRIEDIKRLYTYVSDLKINLPSPYLTTLRTTIPGSASCCLFRADDTAESLAIANYLAHEYTLNNAGIGVNLQTRATGQGVKKNRIIHGGLLPYLKWMEDSVGASKQACYSEDTEILTGRGFINFADLLETDVVGQVYADGSLEFVKPKHIFSYDYTGEMINFKSNRNMGIDLLVTPNHRMAYLHSISSSSEKTIENRKGSGGHTIDSRYQAKPEFIFTEASEFEPKRNTALFFGGNLKGDCELTDWERFEIAFQADGYSSPVRKGFVYAFHFAKQRKIDRLLQITERLGLDTEVVRSENYTTIRVVVGKEMTKDFSHISLSGKSEAWAREFLREASCWDGTLVNDSSKDVVSMQSTTKSVIDFFQALACLCGAYSHVIESTDSRAECQRKPLFSIYISFDRKFTTGRSIGKAALDYDGKVYCVEVETGAIVVRRNGLTSVCGNSRGGSATVTYTILEPDFDDLIRIKNPTTPVDKRVDKLDYSVVVNRSFLRRAAKGEEWMLVSCDDAPELYEALYKSEEEFDEVYDRVSRKRIKKKFVKARDLLTEIIIQRAETGRIYMFFADNVNNHTPFIDTVYQSNLCQEIFLPTKAFHKMTDLFTGDNTEDQELALCFLSSIVAGRVKPEEYEDVAYYTVLTIDNVIETMVYPFKHNEITAKARRSIGVGITNLAHYLASNFATYSDPYGKKLIHELAERHYFWLASASLRLAKEKGNAEWIDKTKWPQGWLPIDTYSKAVDDIGNFELKHDWEGLRQDIIAQGGIRNSVLTAIAPNESSSLVSNTTNSVYPVRDTIMYKQSQKGNVLFIVPDYEKLKTVYQSAWDTPAKDIAEMYGLLTKFMDQGISCDEWVDYSKMDGGRLSIKAQMQFIFTFAKLGGKSLYYLNSKTKSAESLAQEDSVFDEDEGCSSCRM